MVVGSFLRGGEINRTIFLTLIWLYSKHLSSKKKNQNCLVKCVFPFLPNSISDMMYVVPFFFHEIKIWRLFRQTVRRIEVVNIFHFSILNSCTLTYLRDALSPFHENSFENAVNFISYLLAYRHVFVFLRKLLPRSYFPLIIWRMFSRNGK